MTPPNQQNIYNTGVFELRRCAVRRENARFGLCDQKNQERGKHGQLDQATTTAAESCSSVREAIKNLSSAIERNRKRIDNRSQQRNCTSIRPMSKAQRANRPAAISGTSKPPNISTRSRPERFPAFDVNHDNERQWRPRCRSPGNETTAPVLRGASGATPGREGNRKQAHHPHHPRHPSHPRQPRVRAEPCERSAAAKLAAGSTVITRPRPVRRGATLLRAKLNPRQFPLRRRNVSTACRRNPAPYYLGRRHISISQHAVTRAHDSSCAADRTATVLRPVP